jgi:hypothetical protein
VDIYFIKNGIGIFIFVTELELSFDFRIVSYILA